MAESELELAKRIVRDTEAEVIDLREQIDDMECCGYTHSATLARAKLESLEAMVEVHRARLEWLQCEERS